MTYDPGYNLLSNGRRAWLVQASDDAGWNWTGYLTRPVVAERNQWGGPSWITSAPSLKRVREEIGPGDAVFCYQAAPEKAIVGLARIASYGYAANGEKWKSRFDLDWGMRVSPLPYSAMAHDSVLRRLEKVRFAEGTVFRVSEPECKRILALLDLPVVARKAVERQWNLSTIVPARRPPPDQGRPPPRVKIEVTRFIRDTVVARELKQRYDHKCQLCGTRITLPGGGGYSEAHHIRPLSLLHKGRDSRDNLIVLCPTHHAEFDYGVVALSENGKHAVHLDKSNPLHGAAVHYERGHVLGTDVIKYHNRHIYDRQ